MNVSAGSRIFTKWLQAHAALAQGADDLNGMHDSATVDDALLDMESICLPFCRTAVEEYVVA